MKKLLIIALALGCLTLASCGKTTKPTDPEPTTFEKLNVDVSDYEFPEE